MDNNSFEFNLTGDVEEDLDETVCKTTVPLTIVTLPRYLITGINIALVCTSGLVNYFVFTALVRVQFSTLKAKYFIQNSAVANMLVPIFVTADLPFFLSVLSIADSNINLCCWAAYMGFVYFCCFVQVGCTICLTCDRIYAIAAPMLYYRVGYKPGFKILFVVAPWAVSLGIVLIFLFLSIASSPAVSECGACQLLYNAAYILWSCGFVDIYLMTINGLSFLTYIGICVGLKYKRAEIQGSSDSTLKSESLSMAVSFFLVITTTLCLYIPSPMFVWFEDWPSLSADEYAISEMIFKFIDTLYLCNCIVDPLILLFRIRSIRENLPFDIPVCCCRNTESR